MAWSVQVRGPACHGSKVTRRIDASLGPPAHVGIRGRMHNDVMALLFRIVFGIHVLAGAMALLVFWIPLVTKKGGRTHRAFGWVYVAAAATVAVTGIGSAVRLVVEGSGLGPHRGRPWAGIFLVYVGLFAAESALLGVLALRPRARLTRLGRPADLIPPLILVAGGVLLAAFGVAQERLLVVLFAALGVAQGVAHLRAWRAPSSSREGRVLAHMGAMGTSCITTLTAFVVVNAPRLGMRRFDPSVWFVPIVLLGLGLTILRRRRAKRLANGDAPLE